MKIIVYYPTSENGLNELKKNVAKVHADAVSSYISNLPCPKEQKLELIDSLRADACKYV